MVSEDDDRASLVMDSLHQSLIASHHGQLAIIILTGLNDHSLALKLVQRGAQDFVAKVDVSGDNLTRAILYAVERAWLEEEFRKLNVELEQRVKERTAELQTSNRESAID